MCEMLAKDWPALTVVFLLLMALGFWLGRNWGDDGGER